MTDNVTVPFMLEHCASIVLLPTRAALFEAAVTRHEGVIGPNGQFCVATGQFTGRAADDKYIVAGDPKIEFGPAGKTLSSDAFTGLVKRAQAYLHNRQVYVVDFVAGQIKGRVITELAWQALFTSNLLQRVDQPHETPDLTIVALPGFTSGGETCGFKSDAAIACDLANGLVIIAGTAYAGEIKKSVFTYASYVLPLKGELPMHSSVTIGEDGSSAVFFGLSGTGKTTLSADPDRILLGDDEHVWTDDGVLNIEGGCYAKVINLSFKKEPEIWQACHTFGTVLENVLLKEEGDRVLDFSSSELTENTRAAYPLSAIASATSYGVMAAPPTNIIMLTCDAYGVLPSVAKLSYDAAIFHFLSGYTAKIAGTEAGIKEPKATFSRCFGAPFMPHRPQVYADMLKQKLETHQPNVWLVNTGWVRGPYGVGQRIDLGVTRDIIKQILASDSGGFAQNEFRHDDALNLDIPVGVLYGDPTWDNKEAYAEARQKLVDLFQKNTRETMSGVSEAVLKAGPR